MTTINFRGKTLNVVYVDPSLGTGANNGTTPTDAFRSLPLFTSLAANSFYLIRRTGNTISWQKDTNLNAGIQLYGMPFSNETLLYDILPNEAKVAWGGDTASKVKILLNNTTTSLTFSGRDCGTYNIDFVYHDVSITTGIVKFLEDRVVIDSCTFAITGQSISGNNTTSITTNPLYITKGDGFKMVNTKINAHNTSAIQILSSTTMNNIHIEDCDIYNVKGSSYNSFSTVYGLYFSAKVDNSYFKNINIKTLHYGGTNNVQVYDMYFTGGLSNSTLQSISFDTSGTNVNSLNYNKYNIYINSGSSPIYSSQNIIRDININSSMYYAYTPIYASYMSYTTLENININVASAHPTITQYGIQLQSSQYITIDNLNINYAPSIVSTGLIAFNSSGGFRGCLKNSSVHCGGKAFQADDMDVINCNFTGALIFGGRLCEVGTLSLGVSTSSPFIDLNNYNSIVHIENLSGAAATPNIESDGILVIDSALNLSPNMTVLNHGKIYINNELYSGFWRHQTAFNRMLSSSVTRISGGSISSSADVLSYSVRASSLADASSTASRACVISPKPFDGLTVETSGMSLGYKVANLYIGTKFLSSISSKDIWFELEVPKGASGTDTKVISTYSDIEPLADSSQWQGESGITSYVISLPFVLERAENCKARIYSNKFSNLGYIFIDPRILVI